MLIHPLKLRLIALAASLGATVSVQFCPAAVFTNTAASADAFVRAAAPALNYGGAGALCVSGSSASNGSGVTNGIFDSFIRFNTGAMVSNFDSLFGSNNWVISSATLYVTEIATPLNPIFNRGVGRFEVRWMANDNWIEGTGTPMAPTTDGIAYQDEPALLNSATDVSLGVFTNTGVDTNLSFSFALPASFVNDLRAGGEVSFYLTAIDASIGFTFDSRTFVIPAQQPALAVSAVPQPGISELQISGTDVTLILTNGAGGSTYFVLSSTNLGLPVGQWQVVATNELAANGEFSVTITNVVSPVATQQFFGVRTQ